MLYQTGVTVGKQTDRDKLMGVRPEDSSKISALLIELYSSPVTPIREIVANALEVTPADKPAHLELKRTSVSSDHIFGSSDRDNDIYQAIVTDHGCGMSPEFVEEFFVFLGASTKDTDADAIGGFGLGAKSVMSISQHAIWRTVKDGMATVVVLTIGDQGVDVNHNSFPVDEPNGTVSTINLDAKTYDSITRFIGKEFLDYLSPDTPLNVTIHDFGYDIGSKWSNTRYSANDVTFFDSNMWSPHSKILVKGMPYPIPEQVDLFDIRLNAFQGALSDCGISLNDIGRSFQEDLVHAPLAIEFDAQDVIVKATREKVLYTADLEKKIGDKIEGAISEIISKIITDLKNTSDPDEYSEQYVKVRRSRHHITHSNIRKRLAGKTVLFVDSKEIHEFGDRNYQRDLFDSLTLINLNTLYNMNNTNSINNLFDRSETVDEFLGMDLKGAEYIIASNLVFEEVPESIRPNVVKGLSDAEAAAWLLGCEVIVPPSYKDVRKDLMLRGRKKTVKDNPDNKNNTVWFYRDGEEVGSPTTRTLNAYLRDLDTYLPRIYLQRGGEELREQEKTLAAVLLDMKILLVLVSSSERYGTINRNGSEPFYYSFKEVLIHATSDTISDDKFINVAGLPGLNTEGTGFSPVFYSQKFSDGSAYLDRIAGLYGFSEKYINTYKKMLSLWTHSLNICEVKDGDVYEKDFSWGPVRYVNGLVTNKDSRVDKSIIPVKRSYTRYISDALKHAEGILAEGVSVEDVIEVNNALELANTICLSRGLRNREDYMNESVDAVITVAESILSGEFDTLLGIGSKSD